MLSTDHIHAHAYSRVGHKGLIFDRLDVGVADRGDDGSFTQGQFVGHASCGFDTPRIVPFARGFYHNRNRVYMPELGRFAQADPNASGQSLLDMPVYHGGAFSAGAVSFDVQARYGDGGSLYAYMGGNPWMRSDSMGLFFGAYFSALDTQRDLGTNDPFDIVDEYIAEYIASKAAFLEKIYGAYYVAGQVAFAAAQVAFPPLGIGVAAYNLGTGNGSVWDVLAIALPASMAAKGYQAYAASARVYGVGGGIVQATDKVWSLPWNQRGLAIEKLFGKNVTGGGYPGIDKWLNGVGTSIKSLDVRTNSYTTGNTLYNRVKGYVDSIAKWNGSTGRSKILPITPNQILGRELLFVIPRGAATGAQMSQIQRAAAYARSRGVKFILEQL